MNSDEVEALAVLQALEIGIAKAHEGTSERVAPNSILAIYTDVQTVLRAIHGLSSDHEVHSNPLVLEGRPQYINRSLLERAVNHVKLLDTRHRSPPTLSTQTRRST